MLEQNLLNQVKKCPINIVSISINVNIVEQVNASIHSTNYPNMQLKNNKIPTLDWLANTTELNPIEDAWDIIVCDIYRKNGQMFQCNSKS